MEHRRRRRKQNPNQFLMLLIGILAVILVIVVVVAIVAKPGTDTPDNTQNTSSPTDATPVPQGLVISQPAEQKLVVLENMVTFVGTADPKESLTIQGTPVAMGENGSFTHTVTLTTGKNEIPVTYKGETVLYQAEYRYGIQSFSPAEDKTYNSGATVQVEAFVRENATLKVTMNSVAVTMRKAENQVGSGIAEGFVRYTGTYKLPSGNTTDQVIGKFTYTVTCDGITETYESGTIACKAMAEILTSDPSVTPGYGDYIDVGSGYIVEIVAYSAETFYGNTTDDNSDPRNNYLPQGTVDYCRQNPLEANKMSYMVLRCGRRVYVKKNNYPASQKTQVVDCYRGTLPDHNEIGFAGVSQSGHHTIITFDSLWKAPFYFHLEPQEYVAPNNRDFRVTAMTAEYVDITFCYTTVFRGEVKIPADNPLFASAELTQNESDCTLRLYLKKTGGFYGWDAYYNKHDQLCFRFLNPVRSNGADLTGIRVMLDVGHGGLDGGTEVPGYPNLDEAELNLRLANILKDKLEAMGATVIMNRTTDKALNVDERIQYLIEQAPDLCVAIHQNSISGYPNINGAQVLYFTPFSQRAAQLVFEDTAACGVYNKTLLDWHVYYVARQTTCPVVLTENGYVSNQFDLQNMLNEDALNKKADALAQAVQDYFRSN